jgi:hypothetical protein
MSTTEDPATLDELHLKIYKCSEKLQEQQQEITSTKHIIEEKQLVVKTIDSCVKENEQRLLQQAEASIHNLDLIKNQLTTFYNNDKTILQQTHTIEQQALKIASNNAIIQEQLTKTTVYEQHISMYTAKLQEQTTKSVIYEQQIAMYSTKLQEQVTQAAVLEQQIALYSVKLQEQMSQSAALEQQINYNNQMVAAFYASFVNYSE